MEPDEWNNSFHKQTLPGMESLIEPAEVPISPYSGEHQSTIVIYLSVFLSKSLNEGNSTLRTKDEV
jgi:hypothetical protein